MDEPIPRHAHSLVQEGRELPSTDLPRMQLHHRSAPWAIGIGSKPTALLYVITKVRLESIVENHHCLAIQSTVLPAAHVKHIQAKLAEVLQRKSQLIIYNRRCQPRSIKICAESFTLGIGDHGCQLVSCVSGAKFG